MIVPGHNVPKGAVLLCGSKQGALNCYLIETKFMLLIYVVKVYVSFKCHHIVINSLLVKI